MSDAGMKPHVICTRPRETIGLSISQGSQKKRTSVLLGL